MRETLKRLLRAPEEMKDMEERTFVIFNGILLLISAAVMVYVWYSVHVKI